MQRERSFWGDPTYKPRGKDVARFVEIIRELTDGQPRGRKLGLATSAMHAITGFVATEGGPREALSMLDKLKADLTDSE